MFVVPELMQGPDALAARGPAAAQPPNRVLWQQVERQSQWNLESEKGNP